MAADPFRTARLKLGRSLEHADCLEREITRWAEARCGKPPFTERRDFDAEKGCFTFTVESVEPFPDPWPLILGDALVNARAALDHVAWALYVRSGATVKDERHIGFPIREIENFPGEFRSTIVPERLGDKLTPAQVDIIESCQPFELGSDAELHSYAVLDRLVNRDKHRELTLVGAQHNEYTVKVTGSEHFTVLAVEPPEVVSLYLQPGAELGHVCGASTGDGEPNVAVKITGTLSIQILIGDGMSNAVGLIRQLGQNISALIFNLDPVI